jgi:hypothetical protein
LDGYTAAELLIDLAFAVLIKRLAIIQTFSAKAEMKDVARAATLALLTVRQGRKVIADGVDYTLRRH